MSEGFDDAPRWYWAAWHGGLGHSRNAGEKVLIACGQRELWARGRRELDPQDRFSWLSFGERDGTVTMEACFRVFFMLREHYGASLNRTLIELAQVPTFARYVRGAGTGLCNLISNPLSTAPLLREPYERAAEEQLARVVERTLGLPEGTLSDA